MFIVLYTYITLFPLLKERLFFLRTFMNYDFRSVEAAWQKRWKNDSHLKKRPRNKKFYCLDMFPYPSGSGLHVGHWRGYVLSDVYARIKDLQGYEVLHSYGLGCIWFTCRK